MTENSMEMARLVVKAMEDKKAEDIKVLDISNVSVIADYFIICNGTNMPQVEAISDNVTDTLGRAGYTTKRIEGLRNSSWVLMDYNDVIVHIFTSEDRLFYNLERIWKDGIEVNPESFK